MCGIVAVWDVNAPAAHADASHLLESIKHRGPDEQWLSAASDPAVGYARLAIVDSREKIAESDAERGGVVVLLNGEIWNRRALATSCSLPQSCSELEVLRTLYHRYGRRFASYLDGIFAILIVDRRRSKVFLVRDPMGVRPLFYFLNRTRTSFVCASDMKTICRARAYVPAINERYILNEHVFGFSDYDDNLFCELRQVRPGECVEVDAGGSGTFNLRRARYEVRTANTSPAKGALVDAQIATLSEAVLKQYRHNDRYPIGVLLSGGIDSSLLVFLARRQKLEGLVCLYAGPEDSPDWLWAQRVAAATGYPIKRISLEPERAAGELAESCYYLSGLGALLYFLSKSIRSEFPDLKVLWCGEGADELHGGYGYYAAPCRVFDEIKRRAASAGQSSPMIDRLIPLLQEAESTSTEVDCLLAFHRDEQLVNRHLVPLDFAFMASSIELRVPFLDLANVRLAESLPPEDKVGEQGHKPLLKAALRRVSGIQDPRFYAREKLGLLHGLEGVLSALRALAIAEDARAVGQQRLPRESLLAGPLHRLFYRTIQRTFIDPGAFRERSRNDR